MALNTLRYGLPEFGLSGIEFFLRYYLLVFYTRDGLLTGHWAGIGIGLGVFWDALTDPVMGYVADRWNTRWGKRAPYLVFGALLLVFSCWLLFHPDRSTSQFLVFAHLVGAYCLVNTALTLVGIPYSALGSEIGAAPRASVRLYAWRFVFGNVGAVCSTLIPLGLASVGLMEWDTAWLLGLLTAMALVGLLPLIPRHSAVGGEVLERPSVRDCLSNGSFRWLSGALVLGMVGVGLWTSLGLTYLHHYLSLSSSQANLSMALFLLGSCVATPFWVRLGARNGACPTLSQGLGYLGIGTAVLYYFATPGSFPVAALGNLLLGAVMGCCGLLDACLGEIVEAKGRRSSLALYFGLWKFTGKASRALSLVLAGFLTSFLSLHNGEMDPARTQWLPWIYGPFAGLFLYAAAQCLRRIPLLLTPPEPQGARPPIGSAPVANAGWGVAEAGAPSRP